MFRHLKSGDEMDFLTLLYVLPFLWACFHIFNHRSSGKRRSPPGPYPYPIFGNIFQLGDKPHHAVTNLSKKYGPIMSLKLGSLNTIVVSSPKLVKEIMHKNDLITSSRTIPSANTAIGHDKFSVVWLPIGKEWRNLRKVCKEQMLTNHQLEVTKGLRQKKTQELLDYAQLCCARGEAMDIGKALFTTGLNLISNTFFSIDLGHHDSSLSQEFKELTTNMFHLAAKPNLADYFPILKWVDPQGIRREMAFYMRKLMHMFDDIVDQRLKSRSSSPNSPVNHDVLEGLIEITAKAGNEVSWNDLKHLLLDLFAAGTDTSASTVEFAMAELIRNPEKMAKARIELEQVIGKDNAVQESDISKLPYLQALVKETLRLHPPGPFLVPRKAEADIEVDGYLMPKNSQILVNVWAIGRDPSIWPNPDSFIPERFLESEVDFRGKDFELIPFGSGRRICPGLPLADRMVHLMLGSLLHSFDWKLEGGKQAKDVDISEKFGLSLHMEVPIKAIPIKP